MFGVFPTWFAGAHDTLCSCRSTNGSISRLTCFQGLVIMVVHFHLFSKNGCYSLLILFASVGIDFFPYLLLFINRVTRWTVLSWTVLFQRATVTFFFFFASLTHNVLFSPEPKLELYLLTGCGCSFSRSQHYYVNISSREKRMNCFGVTEFRKLGCGYFCSP